MESPQAQAVIDQLQEVVFDGHVWDTQRYRQVAIMMQNVSPEVQRQLNKHQYMEWYLHCCISRADLEIKQLVALYGRKRKIYLIPISLWVLFSSRSKRYVEPLLVSLYGPLREKYGQIINRFAYIFPLTEPKHTPINAQEKSGLVLVLLAVYAFELPGVSELSVVTYLEFVKALLTGIGEPSKNPAEIGNENENVVQASLEPPLLKLILESMSRVPSKYKSQVREVVKLVHQYAGQHVICDILLITEFLLNPY